MSSINKHPTFIYSQPEEYRFSHDSVFLAQHAYHAIKSASSPFPLTVLDLCAGCGIVGMDLAFHAYRDNLDINHVKFHFLEVQPIYASYWEKNLKTLKNYYPQITESQFELHITNYNAPISLANNSFDLLVCNPPYFEKGQGTLSPSLFKNRCRFFIDSDFENLIRAIERLLSPQGKAFVLLRNQKSHGVDVIKKANSFLTECTCVIDGQIRGTDIALIQKKL